MASRGFLSAIVYSIALVFSAQNLRAEAWGPTGATRQVGEIKWDQVGCELKDSSAHFFAYVPHYSHYTLEADTENLQLIGKNEPYFYIISVNYYPYSLQGTKGEFREMLERIYDHVSIVEDPGNYGARFVADVDIVDEGALVFWRFIVGKDLFIKLGTADPDAVNRGYFFDSILVANGSIYKN
ncbi:MAG: hypothetical protein ACOYK9_05255 [Chlamydiia bacterium]